MQQLEFSFREIDLVKILSEIANEHGKPDWDRFGDYDCCKEGSYFHAHRYENEELVIIETSDCDGINTGEIRSHGKVVFSYTEWTPDYTASEPQLRFEKYIPGSWERNFRLLHKELLSKDDID